MNNLISTIHLKRVQIFVGLLFVFALGNMNAQIVPISNPNGGFEIDGNLESNDPTTGVGDWVEGASGSGGLPNEKHTYDRFYQ
jgi:hypothetical protein